MTDFSRYAIYYTCPPGPMAEAGASWLGWDIDAGAARPLPDVSFDIAAATATPQKYGFHGTLKPPIRLAEGRTADEFHAAARALAETLTPFELALKVSRLGTFLALTPGNPAPLLADLAGACVTELDSFRAAAEDAELAKRRKAGLTEVQDTLLLKWGYPYVLEEFRFHMTLSGKLEADILPMVKEAAEHHFSAAQQRLAVFDAISLCGERADGRFELIERIKLGG